MSYNAIAGAVITHALRRVGLIVVPVNYRLRGPEVAYVLNDSGARVVCADDDHVEVVDVARLDVKGERSYVAIGNKQPAGWKPFRELMEVASDEQLAAQGSGALGASMIYTSGTTGNPK